MAENLKDSGVVQLPPQQMPTNPLLELISNKRVKDLVFDIAEKQIKDAAGIETNKKVNNKTPFGRTVTTIKDFIQGTFWVFLISSFFLMMTFIFYLWLRKVLGV